MGHPTVEVTMLFTDIEGSTALAHELGDGYVDVLAQHNRIIRDAIGHRTGVEARNEGDSFFAVFDRASDAVAAALTAQRSLAAHEWPHGRPVRVRMGLHSGPAIRLLHDFAGLNVHLASRVSGAAHGGQVIASQAVLDALGPDTGLEWIELGPHIVKDFPDPITLHQLAADGLDTTFPPLVTIDARDHNLPSMVTSFVGRQDELAELRTLLSGDARLVTLTGPGGVGKTRLALEATWSVLSRYRAGAWFVDLAPLTDPDRIVDAIAEALNVRDEPGTSRRDLVVEKLSTAPVLLVVDNLEHLLSGVTVVAELLAACPSLVVLATSRERLRLQGEHEVLVDGLATGDAVDLFTRRAMVVRRDFVADDRVGVLCERVGYLPLAIELAAARIRTHSVDALVAAMDSMLDTLTEGERDRPARHQAMRAAIALSVDALTEAERSVFRAFSVFAGGATGDAIAAVCIPKADEVAALVDKSLLRDDEGRFVMLEPIRQYAEERLAYDVPGEREQRVQAHAQYFLELAERLEPELVTARQRDALDALTADHANLRAAIERATGDTPLRIAACLTQFWTDRGRPHEGRSVLRSVLLASVDANSEVKVRALVGAGQLAVLQHDLDVATAAFEEAIGLRETSAVHSGLGNVWRLRGDLDAAERHYGLALSLGEATKDDRAVAVALSNQGAAAFARGDFERAAELFGAAVRLCDLTGDLQLKARATGNLGFALRSSGDAAGAIDALQESVALAREMGNRGAEAAALLNLAGAVQLATGLEGTNEQLAGSYLRAAIEIFDELGYRRELAQALLGVPAVSDDVDEVLRSIARARAIYVELRDNAGIAAADASRAACELPPS